MDVLDVLLQKKVISEERLNEIRNILKTKDVHILDILKEDAIDEKILMSALSESSGVPIGSVDEKRITKAILDFIPEDSAKIYKIVPFDIVDGALYVGALEPDSIEVRDAINFISSRNGMPYKLFVISQKDFDTVFVKYSGLSEEVTENLGQIDEETKKDFKNEEEGSSNEEPAEVSEINAGVDVSKETDDSDIRIIEDAPVTKIVATILRYATEGNASDVHLEHTRESIRVRFRVDGVLNTSLVLPREVYSAVVARIKILSNMKLDEKRRPQDGRFSAKIDGRKIDFRVSTFPTYYGEKVVMRILDQGKGIKKLEELGISARNIDAIRRALKRPYGIILISGPTGSGKTTTLYSMLQEINDSEKNILSLEDPIEYNIDGVNQSQVRPDIGYTFANGLRTTLRQDPDVIMVGEIRDKETAQLAIQAALTGHLVFSTIHTNNAFGVIPRLIDMGVDPYLIAPTLTLAIAQRLVRKRSDPKVGTPIPIEGSLKIMIDKEFESVPFEIKKTLPFTQNFFDAAPTAESPSGISGRTVVMEVIEMDKELEQAILTEPNEQHISSITRKQGFLTIKQDAIIKAMNGGIPFEEINSV